MTIIAILDSASPESRGDVMNAFYRGLEQTGVDSQSTMVLYSWADNDYDGRLPALAQQLAANNDVGVIVTFGGPVAALAARKATHNKPIVFTTITDPATSGIVKNLKNPDTNMTGTWGFTTELDEKRLQALSDLVPEGAIGILANPKRPYPINADPARQKSDLQAKAAAVGRTAIVVDAATDSEIDGAFDRLSGQVVGLTATADPFFSSRRARVLALAERLAVPAIYQWSAFVTAGGLMSYGPSQAEGFRNAGEYAGRILKGESPASLPVREVREHEFVLNSSTVRSFHQINPSNANFNQMIARLGNPKVRTV